MIIFFYIALFLLAVIFFQDLRSRAIWWFLPPVLFGCFVILNWSETTVPGILLNAAFVTALIGFLVIYIRFRFGKLQNPFKEHFGLGDFLFLLALTPLFQFREFIWFFTFGTLAVLVVHLAVYLFKKTSTIPYAGYLALFTGFYLVTNRFYPTVINALTDLNG